MRALVRVAIAVAVALLAASCGGEGGDQSGGCGDETVALIALDLTFDKETISLSAGTKTTICLDNQDAGLPHNVAIYEDETAEEVIFQGVIVEGPTITRYTFTAPDAGTYFFRCDLHPVQMTGTVIVE